MNKVFIVLFFIAGLNTAYSQRAGEFQLGLRSTTSLFSHDSEFGTGVGGQFRLRLFERMNTEWFADFITSDILGAAKRSDSHIGWSVMFYPLPARQRLVQPYILMGHCFDYTRVEVFETGDFQDRWSSAFQTGIGTHFNISERTDLSLNAQYMGHIGKDLHVEYVHDHNHSHSASSGNHDDLVITTNPSSRSLEGHLLITVSFNVKIAKLWSGKL